MGDIVGRCRRRDGGEHELLDGLLGLLELALAVATVVDLLVEVGNDVIELQNRQPITTAAQPTNENPPIGRRPLAAPRPPDTCS